MIRLKLRAPRILDFDTECRPMHYSEWRPESQITAIAWSWIGDDEVHSAVLHQDLRNTWEMLGEFLLAYENADMVTGHYIRKHDLPLLNDHVMRLDVAEVLSPKLTQDTHADMTSIKGLGKSQDNLAVTFGLAEQKHHMTGADWLAANSLTPAGRVLTRKRVVDDVIQHKRLREALLERGILKAPEMWYP